MANRSENETTLIGKLYVQRERNGSKKEVATVGGDVAANTVQVAAYPDSGVSAGDLQAVINALADRIEALENA